jgi:hypothetical protein
VTLPAALPGRALFAFLSGKQVVLASPYPPAECGRRLEAATGRTPWNIAGFQRASGLPLQGQVSPAVIRVARRRPANRRSNLEAQFIGRIEQARDGGTLVVGMVGPEQSMLILFVVFPVAWLLIGGGLIMAGLWSLLSGHLQVPHLLQLVIPIVIGAGYVQSLLTSPAKVQAETQRLLDELNMILDSTAIFSDDHAHTAWA